MNNHVQHSRHTGWGDGWMDGWWIQERKNHKLLHVCTRKLINAIILNTHNSGFVPPWKRERQTLMKDVPQSVFVVVLPLLFFFFLGRPQIHTRENTTAEWIWRGERYFTSRQGCLYLMWKKLPHDTLFTHVQQFANTQKLRWTWQRDSFGDSLLVTWFRWWSTNRICLHSWGYWRDFKKINCDF